MLQFLPFSPVCRLKLKIQGLWNPATSNHGLLPRNWVVPRSNNYHCWLWAASHPSHQQCFWTRDSYMLKVAFIISLKVQIWRKIQHLDLTNRYTKTAITCVNICEEIDSLAFLPVAQARSSRGGAGGPPPPLFGQRMPWPPVSILIFVVSSCRLQGSVSKLNVPLRIWIGMGHKVCTLWHKVYLRHPSMSTAACSS